MWLRSRHYQKVYGQQTRTGYTFECHKGVCLCKVKGEDVIELLRLRGCCGHTSKVLHKATPGEIKAWLKATGSEHR